MNVLMQALAALSNFAKAVALLLRGHPATVKRTNDLSIHIEKSPNQINAADIISLVILAFLKYIPGYSPSLKAQSGSQEFILPLLRAEGLLHIGQDEVSRFQQSITPGTASSGETTNPFFLVAQTVPLIIYFLVNRACPIRPFGAVNTRNVITLVQPDLCRDAEALRIAADQSKLTYSAFIGGSKNLGHRRKRGVEFCITIQVLQHGGLIMTQECWFLQFLPASFEPRYQAVDGIDAVDAGKEREDATCVAEHSLHMTLDDALRWAASSKDYDGIHVSPFVARLFGFKGVLAHGNHVAALAVQQLAQNVEVGASEVLWRSKRPYTIEIKFVRPMLLPSTLMIQWQAEKSTETTARLEALRHGKVCMEGRVVLED